MAEEAPRAAAARALIQVIDGGSSLSAVLPRALASVAPRDRGLVQELCYGALRWQPRLEFLLARLLQKPLKARDRDLHGLLLVGLYQLGFLSVPAHVVVSETVSAAETLGRGWAKGLVNAVLRRYQREAAALAAAAEGDETAHYAHPGWLLAKLKSAWPDAWQGIAEANNARPPLTLRINLAQTTRDAYLNRLQAEGIGVRTTPNAASAITLESAIPVEQIPGFADGLVSVQDAAAQMAAPLLDPQGGDHVLDACAAPGGKTSHLLEQRADLSVDALDCDATRLDRVRENLARLHLSARIVTADAGEPKTWWDGRSYDRILLDAPCSATGVIRRHPDIKALRKPDDIPALVKEQARLLRGLWPLLKRGGMLVYATCSILPEENGQQIGRFLAQTPDAADHPIGATWGRPVEAGRQILPGEEDMDGFYYACIAKR